MDRLELRTRFAASVEKVRLGSIDLDFYIHKLSALDRARMADKYRILERDSKSDAPSDDATERMTVGAQAFIISRGLVTEAGVRIYKDDEVSAIVEEFPCDALDQLAMKILRHSGIGEAEVDLVKNSEPALSAVSNSVSE
jgi:hypothetical protein